MASMAGTGLTSTAYISCLNWKPAVMHHSLVGNLQLARVLASSRGLAMRAVASVSLAGAWVRQGPAPADWHAVAQLGRS